jgi:GH15 family glucan-1,4-alpha-glucosidase
MSQKSLELGLIGNCSFGALIDERSDMVWCCLPAFDSPPVFDALLRHGDDAPGGRYLVEIADFVHAEQQYVKNTAILATRLYDRNGGCVEVTDFAPRFRQFGRMFTPMMLVRQVRPVAGSPRVCLRLQPAGDVGGTPPSHTRGSNHIRYLTSTQVIRLTTDAAITAILEESFFFLDELVTLILGPDETVPQAPGEAGSKMLAETRVYWEEWTRYMTIPYEWQEAVIRAAITLKLNTFEDTGAVVAAVTTSIPEAPNSGRNWDYRYCWLRDAYFVVSALNRLGKTQTMERYLRYIINLAANQNHDLQPVYRLSGGSRIDETDIDSLSGYRGMGPVRVGNAAYHQEQNDVYGAVVLAASHVFIDERIAKRGDETLFRRLEPIGELARSRFDQPDAGIWEFRNINQVHTFSSVMCWVACDRLSRLAGHLGLDDRARYWRDTAAPMRELILNRAWNEQLQSFVASFNGEDLDASLLLLHELGFVAADDPRFVATVERVAERLKEGSFLYRYVREDDFGFPETAFTVCTFWYIDALHAIGRADEARDLFEQMLRCRNRLGLLSEDLHPETHELWGNFPQTYSMVGIISSAMRLSKSWEEAF